MLWMGMDLGIIWCIGLPLLPSQMKIICFFCLLNNGCQGHTFAIPGSAFFFFILCVFKYRVHVLFYFPWRLNCCFFFIYKDVLKSHLEALKIFLAAARSRYIKSIHFTNENDWYTSKKLSASDNKTQLKSLSKSPLQEFHWKGRFLGNSGVGILGKGRIGDGECWLQKRSTMWELWAKFYLEQNKDYSLGDSISDSP